MRRNLNQLISAMALAVRLGLPLPASAQTTGDDLRNGFEQPPASAKPRVWWHWMNGNVTKEGITADLEWMARTGIGGMNMFDGSLGTPQFVEKRLVWMTPEWKDAFRHAAAEADRLGLEMSMAASGGWSESGGPSVKPEQAMKKVVWSETEVAGPRSFTGTLPQPPSVNGVFQNISRESASHDPSFYADTKVLAYRLPDREVRMADLHPKVTSSVGAIDGAALMDGDVSRTMVLPFAQGANEAWVQFAFAEPFHAEAFTFASTGGGSYSGPVILDGRVQASQDGSTWQTLITLPGPGHPFSEFPVRTYSFPPITAGFFRVTNRSATAEWETGCRGEYR